MKFSRTWEMPNANTFSIAPIAKMVNRYLKDSKVSIDPFARNSRFATYRNDMNPKTSAEYHMHAVDFVNMLYKRGVKADMALLDPPYSPTQVKEHYQSTGLEPVLSDYQNVVSPVNDALLRVLTRNAIVLSFGWNSNGMGINRGFELIEVQLVAHGRAHNDTICIAERRLKREGFGF